MLTGLYIVVVVDKEGRYYNKVDVKRVNSSKKMQEAWDWITYTYKNIHHNHDKKIS